MSVVGQNEIDPNIGSVHPSLQGYQHIGEVWANAIRHLPPDWLAPSVGPDPVRPTDQDSNGDGADPSANGDPDPNIPQLDFRLSPMRPQVEAKRGVPRMLASLYMTPLAPNFQRSRTGPS